MYFSVVNDDFLCDFCNLEFSNAVERTEHTLQHFRQSHCSGCGEILICIGDIWYGPHTSSNANTDITSEVEVLDEEVLLENIEIKQEQIIDIDGDDDDENDGDFEEVVNVYDGEEISIHDEDSNMFVEDDSDENETKTYDDDEQATEEHNEIPNLSSKYVSISDDKLTATHHVYHKNKHIVDKPVEKLIYRLEYLNKPTEMERLGGEDLPTALTREQLKKGQCPICGKIIVNKQNLICHMNIHSGRKPFYCNVCSKSFAHIRNLVRHKEQQGHCDMEFKCTVRGCRKSFMTSNKMNRHIKLDHETVGFSINRNGQLCPFEKTHPYQCIHCNKTFSSNGYLNMHIKQGHRDIQ